MQIQHNSTETYIILTTWIVTFIYRKLYMFQEHFSRYQSLKSGTWKIQFPIYVNAHLLLNELPMPSQRQLRQLTPRSEKSPNLFNDNKMKQFRIFHCEFHAAVNLLWPGPQRFAELSDATTNCASNGEIMFLLIWRFSQRKILKAR